MNSQSSVARETLKVHHAGAGHTEQRPSATFSQKVRLYVSGLQISRVGRVSKAKASREAPESTAMAVTGPGLGFPPRVLNAPFFPTPLHHITAHFIRSFSALSCGS